MTETHAKAIRTLVVLACTTWICACSTLTGSIGTGPSRSNPEMGRQVYRKACLTCHGAQGDGNGPAARFLEPKPRDFTTGRFKFRMTPSGELPTDDDLFRTISVGIPGTQMPAWKRHLSATERWAVVEYVKSFAAAAFEEEGPGDPIEIPDPPPVTAEGLAEGAQIYVKMKCGECHGDAGRGDGPSASTLLDEKLRPIWPYDFTSGRYRGGSGEKDVYRTLSTGLAGTPMPGYVDLLTPQERWRLVQFVRSLERERGWFGSVLDYLFAPSGSWE